MFVLPKLDYAYNALEPHIDELTMTIHHTKHHQAYIDNANKALAGTPMESWAVEDILKDLSKTPDDKRNAVRNNAGGHYNHSLFWQMMGPGKGGSPSGNLGDAIKEKFGGFDKVQEQFANAGLTRFGSGWAWLVSNKGTLEIVSTANQDTPLSEGKIPLLGCDVWEHAYYVRYFNKRADYIKAWWNVVNWDFVQSRFKG
ncbi:superoxide dismutase [Candidatus Micrarchaeota archaeon]|nr:superoxide dismutase [Candidatus Micrarchaeota archaeon]